ncbi:NepR family anti-sigma factor [Stappia sp.]|jgi:hemerythrin-like domain-containing protein|uniref:NepR family anti-sigma factor n=1 Tax=Stappia sp. TaxID=1870903 RepID=UPI003D0C9BB3
MNGFKKTAAGSTPHPGKHSTVSHEQITEKLREFYDSVQDEDIPDRFLELLERLDEAEKKVSGSGGK